MVRAYSSVVEHYVDIVGVASSILATPTIHQEPRSDAGFFVSSTLKTSGSSALTISRRDGGKHALPQRFQHREKCSKSHRNHNDRKNGHLRWQPSPRESTVTASRFAEKASQQSAEHSHHTPKQSHGQIGRRRNARHRVVSVNDKHRTYGMSHCGRF